jgi:hypothetical protein
MLSLRPLLLVASATLLLGGCADPPEKEIHQAQGAIDAARAAGAEQYAGEELEAAVTALGRSHQAVGERDFRLALNHAIDARERAQEAAREAAERKAVVRTEAQQAINAVAAASTRAASRLADAEAARVPARELTPIHEEIATADASLQEARAAFEAQDYLAARDSLDGAEARLTGVTGKLDEAIATRPPRRRR